MAGAIPDIVIRLVADVDDFIRDWDRAADAAERAAARIRAAGAAAGDGPDAGRFRDLNAELDRLTRAAREAADSIRDLGNSSRGASDDVESLRRRLGDLEGSLGGATRGMSGMAGGGKGMLVVFALIASMLPGIIAGIFALGAAATGLVLAIGVAALGSKGLGEAFDRLKTGIAPLRAELDGLFKSQLGDEFAALGMAITSYLTPAFRNVATAISEVIKDTTQWIRSSEGIATIKTAMGGTADLVRAMSPAVKGLVQIFLEFAASAAPSMKKIGEAISFVVVTLRDMFREADKSGQLTRIFEAGAEAIKGFGEIIKGVLMILMEMADQGGLPAADAMKKLGQALQDAAPAIGTFFKALAMIGDVIMTVVAAISAVVGWIAEMGAAMGDTDKNSQAIKDFFAGIPAVAGKAGDAVMGFFADLKKNAAVIDLADFGPWLNKVNQDMSQGTDKALATVKQWVSKTNDDVKAWGTKLNDAVKSGWDKTNAAIKAGVDKALAPIKEWWDKTVSETTAGAGKAVAAVKQWADSIVQSAKQLADKFVSEARAWWDKTVSAVKDGADKAVEFVKGMVDDLVDTVMELPGKFVEAGKALVDGLIEGAKSQIQALIDIFAGMAADALAAVKSALGIASPSKVFADEVGAQIPAGIAQGIAGGAPLIRSALRNLPLNANVALSGAAGQAGAIGMGAGRQVIEVKLAVGSGGDGALGQAIAKLGRTGQLKLSANAVVAK